MKHGRRWATNSAHGICRSIRGQLDESAKVHRQYVVDTRDCNGPTRRDSATAECDRVIVETRDCRGRPGAHIPRMERSTLSPATKIATRFVTVGMANIQPAASRPEKRSAHGYDERVAMNVPFASERAVLGILGPSDLSRIGEASVDALYARTPRQRAGTN